MIHLIVGNTGSGKTTYANSLKKMKNAVLFSIDEWNKILFLDDKTEADGYDWMMERINRAETMIFALIHQLETSKTDSILDLGLSTVIHRDKMRSFASENNYDIKTHFLDIDTETRSERVQKRNEDQGDTFQFIVSDGDFGFMEKHFERPSEIELKNAIVITE